MEDIIKNDLHFEHPQHFTYQEGCSTCWAENLKMNRERRQSLGTSISAGRHIDDPRIIDNPLE